MFDHGSSNIGSGISAVCTDVVQTMLANPWFPVAVCMLLFYSSLLQQGLRRQARPDVASRDGLSPRQAQLVSHAQARPEDVLPVPPVLTAADHVHDNKAHLLLCATGSVATIKIPNIISALAIYQGRLSIRLVLTRSAAEFLRAQSSEQPSLASIAKMPCVDGVYLDKDEWRRPWTRGASILHIELRRWADLMVVAPLSANSLAKLANGLSDNLVSSVARAWDASGLIDPPRAWRRDSGRDSVAQPTRKRIVVAPAMNTAMWIHPATAKHLSVLEGDWSASQPSGWFEVLRPVEKSLACGDVGSGAMREWKEIVTTIEDRLALRLEDSMMDVTHEAFVLVEPKRADLPEANP